MIRNASATSSTSAVLYPTIARIHFVRLAAVIRKTKCQFYASYGARRSLCNTYGVYTMFWIGEKTDIGVWSDTGQINVHRSMSASSPGRHEPPAYIVWWLEWCRAILKFILRICRWRPNTRRCSMSNFKCHQLLKLNTSSFSSKQIFQLRRSVCKCTFLLFSLCHFRWKTVCA